MRPLRIAPLLFALALAGCASLPAGPAPSAIGTVQGSGARSPLIGQPVVVEGVIAAQLPELQLTSLVGAPDGDEATSDALFLPANDLAPGTRIRVRGTVAERDTGNGSTLTMIEPASLTVLGHVSVPAPFTLTAVPASREAWESLEAMPVRFEQTLTVVGTQNAGRFGEWLLASGERPWTPTERALPGDAANALAKDNRSRLVWLDDGRSDENPKASVLLPAGIAPRTGSVVRDASGVVDERFGKYRVQVTTTPNVSSASSPTPPQLEGEVRIAAFNLENLFNGDGQGGGFPTPRGAKTFKDYALQRDSLVAAIRGLNPDIAAVMELESDGEGPLSSESQLLTALNRDGSDWRAVRMPKNASTDAIRVGILYRASRVTPVGASATLDAGQYATSSRPPLAQAFRAGSGPAFTVVANHLKSKGCGNAKGNDADRRDGQSCWNATRVQAVQSLQAWLATDPVRSGSPHRVLLGDFNAYAMEDPLRWLREQGWQDAFAIAQVEHAYSYVYDGQIGRLDHALVSPSLATRVQGAAEWHINADEPDLPRTQVSPLRSSDHDPLLITLRLRSR